MNVVQLALVNNVETSKPLQKTSAPQHRNNNQFRDELHRAVHKSSPSLVDTAKPSPFWFT